MKIPISAILVPQGAEYKSVCKGLNGVVVPLPPVFPIPIGTNSVKKYLEKWQQTVQLGEAQPRVLLMGLCGSLSTQYNVGDVVLYRSCIYSNAQKNQQTQLFCDSELTALLQEKLHIKAFTGHGYSSDRLIYSACEKLYLGQVYGAEVVDMEGFAALETLNQLGVPVAMLRVISDDARHNIPNLTNAFDSNGALQALPLAMGLLREPIAATRLIFGSLRGLQILQNITTFLFKDKNKDYY